MDAALTVAPYIAEGNYYASGGGYNIQADQAFRASNAAIKEANAKFVEKDLYDEEEVAKNLLPYDAEDESVFGEKSDSLVQSGGQLVAQLGAD